jgi:hypothetical protein
MELDDSMLIGFGGGRSFQVLEQLMMLLLTPQTNEK